MWLKCVRSLTGRSCTSDCTSKQHVNVKQSLKHSPFRNFEYSKSKFSVLSAQFQILKIGVKNYFQTYKKVQHIQNENIYV